MAERGSEHFAHLGLHCADDGSPKLHCVIAGYRKRAGDSHTMRPDAAMAQPQRRVSGTLCQLLATAVRVVVSRRWTGRMAL